MSKLQSEKVVLSSPMSFAGSAARSWKIAAYRPYDSTATFGVKLAWVVVRVCLIIVALFVIAAWWSLIVCWYLLFGLLVVPWRLLRRGQRKDKKRQLQHREILEAIEKKKV